MARYVVVLPLQPLTPGDEFTVAQWPLHVTLVEPFETDLEAEALGTALEPVAASAAPVRVAVGDDAMFGPRRDIPVSLIRDAGAMAALRSTAMAALQAQSVDFGHVRLDYRPHVTAKQHGRVHEGDRLELGTLALVRLRPPETSHHGRIAGSWPLGSAETGPKRSAT